jgi:hypothetical protein
VGEPKESDFRLVEEAVPTPGAGQMLLRTLWLSLDPYMRGRMNAGKSYAPPVGIGDVMVGGTVTKVVASNLPGFAPGDIVEGRTGWQDYAVSDGVGLRKVDPSLGPLSTAVGVLGMPGMTAYTGLLNIGQPKPGETVVVAAASGAVGSVVGQIAKIKGCRAVGIAGGPQKCGYLTKELGFDAAIDYKNEDVGKALRQHCPNGVNLYFDNVGGDLLDVVLAQLARFARVVICGAISQYNTTTGIKGPSNYLSLLINSARMEGFIVFNYASRYGEAAREMAGWMAAGKLKSKEDIVEGFHTFPETLLKLFRGENFGKLMLKLAD